MAGDGWSLPFERAEYEVRLAKVREEMARRGLDLLYVTSPPNLTYLLGHQAVWFDARNVTGLAVPREPVDPIYLDTYDHAPGWPAMVQDAVTYGEHGFYYPEGAQVVTDTLRGRGLLEGRVGLEYWSWAPGGPAFAELTRRLTVAGADVVDGSWVVDHVRLVKSPHELAYVREALAIADAAYEALAAALAPGMTEHEIDALLSYECKRRGGDDPGIRTMVRTGPKTAAFHAPAGDRPIRQGELLMIDMSAVRHQYHGNTARAFSLGENAFWTDALAKLVEARDTTCAQIRAGDPTMKLQRLMDAAVDAAGLRDHVWWVGGYVLGIAEPPDWVGHVYLNDEEGFEPGVFDPGFVANWEVQLWDPPEGGGVGVIDTMLTSAHGIEIPARFPGTLTVV